MTSSDTKTGFAHMGLPESLTHTLQHMQFNEPTPIQEQAIPYALNGHDILGSAQTGTGKTGAFGIPLVAHILSKPMGSALVMTPTRELATQVMMQLKAMLGKSTKIKTALLIGGEPMPKQIGQLRNRPRVIVGTPGRINDHLQRRNLMLDDADFLVLDETDRMLDMGFTSQIEDVLRHMAETRQTLLFSATLPDDMAHIADKYLNGPIRVSVDPVSSAVDRIEQEILRVNQTDKYPHLVSQLKDREGSVIVFVKTKYGAEKLAKKLNKDDIHATALHGDMKQGKRDRVIIDFRKQKYRILVATDVAARGLDIPHIGHVINFDLPQCPEDYIHRIGRTARAGADGCALNFVTPADGQKWRAIENLLNPKGKTTQDNKPKKGKKKRPKRKKDYKLDKDGYAVSTVPTGEWQPLDDVPEQSKPLKPTKPKHHQKPTKKRKPKLAESIGGDDVFFVQSTSMVDWHDGAGGDDHGDKTPRGHKKKSTKGKGKPSKKSRSTNRHTTGKGKPDSKAKRRGQGQSQNRPKSSKGNSQKSKPKKFTSKKTVSKTRGRQP